MTYCLEQIQRAHDIRLEGPYWIRPGHGGQALRTEMKYVRRLTLNKDLRNSLAISQITRRET